jgi:hydroxymethylpyrimidine/phosphomethylpyrimidine kinase
VTRSTHGTGCAFSSAFLSRLVLGDPPIEAARVAKVYVAQALRTAVARGQGNGPLNLLWPLVESGRKAQGAE